MDNMFELLQSNDWKERVQGEYLFIKSKTDNLKCMLENYANDALDFKPNCTFELLMSQYNAMMSYLNILEMRMHIEKIEIFNN